MMGLALIVRTVHDGAQSRLADGRAPCKNPVTSAAATIRVVALDSNRGPGHATME
jgi:hypothetical protein